MRAIVYANPDGTAAVVAPVARDGETEMATLVRVARELGIPEDGWDAVRPELVAALRRADQPAPGSVVSRAEVVRRTYPLTIALATRTGDDADPLRAKWKQLLDPLQYFSEIHLADPTVAALVAVAVKDGLLTPDQAAAVTAH